MQQNFRKQLDPQYKATRQYRECSAIIGIAHSTDGYVGVLQMEGKTDVIAQIEVKASFKCEGIKVGMVRCLQKEAEALGYRVIAVYK